MMYTKPHTDDTRKTELCEYCRFRQLCNEKNKTYAPMLTACACNIALLEEVSKDVEQENGKIVVRENASRKAGVFAYAELLLERLFTADILCDTPHTNDTLRTAVQKWLVAYFGTEYGKRLEKHPNEKPSCMEKPLHPVPKQALELYTDADPLCCSLVM